MQTLRNNVVIILFCFIATMTCSQGLKSDYDRANNFHRKLWGKLTNKKIDANWTKDGKFLLFNRESLDGKNELMKLNLESNELIPAIELQKLSSFLKETLQKNFEPSKIPIKKVHLSEEGDLWILLYSKSFLGIVNYKSDETFELKKIKEANPFELKPLPMAKGKRSREHSVSSEIIFVNRTSDKIKTFWIDNNGGHKPYKTIGPGETHSQSTSLGDHWMVKDQNDQPITTFSPSEKKILAVVDTDLLANKPTQNKTNPKQKIKTSRKSSSRYSADGKWQVFIRDQNVWLGDRKTKEEFQISKDGSAEDYYAKDVTWSPDSKFFMATQTRAGEKHIVSMVESSPKDQLQPKLHQNNYLKPGHKIPLPRPQLFSVESKSKIKIDESDFSNPWSVLWYVWSKDSEWCYFYYNQRGHQIARVLGIQAKTGDVKVLVEERSDTFIDYTNKTYIKHLNELDQVIWMSERSGWNHLYRYDRKTGEVINAITSGEWLVKSVENVDEEKQELLLKVTGVYPEQDPYYEHFARVKFDGSEFKIFTKGNGTHRIEMSPDKKYFVDSWSRVDQPPIYEVRKAVDGELIKKLCESDDTKLAKVGWQRPIPFVSKGRYGEIDIYGVIYRPSNFDPKKKYPVIESIYAGPHSFKVPKKYHTYNRELQMAELGFIVVQIDGMGTNWRSKKFHNVCYQNIADAGFPDRIAWMKRAAEKYTWMDLSRVGIFGGSAGGQNAMRALIAHSDFYSVAAADCGCHDNRMDKVWWNEQWMGWPIKEHIYDKSSNVVHAKRMNGKLMLLVGELDRNVDPASTMQVVNALIKANKDFDLVVIPGGGHGAGYGKYGMRRIQDFFVRNLLKVEPRRF